MLRCRSNARFFSSSPGCLFAGCRRLHAQIGPTLPRPARAGLALGRAACRAAHRALVGCSHHGCCSNSIKSFVHRLFCGRLIAAENSSLHFCGVFFLFSRHPLFHFSLQKCNCDVNDQFFENCDQKNTTTVESQRLVAVTKTTTANV